MGDVYLFVSIVSLYELAAGILSIRAMPLFQSLATYLYIF
jgi:hypothetical protein